MSREEQSAIAGQTKFARLADRDRRILEMRAAGHTLQEIGDAVGLTRERVRQLISKSGGPSTEELRKKKAQKRIVAERALRERMRAFIQERGATTFQEIASDLGLSEAQVRRLFPRELRARIIPDEVAHPKEWSDDQICDALRTAATFEFPLTTATYHDLVRKGAVEGPSVPLVYRRYGSWVKACLTAGVESGEAIRDNYDSRWSNADILNFVSAYLHHPDYGGTFRQYDEWRRKHMPDAPSGVLARNRFGSWSRLKRLALTGVE